MQNARAHCSRANTGRTRSGGDPKLGSSLQAIFTARLRSALDARNIAANAKGRATALATRLGCSVSTTTRWLNGDMMPSLETLSEISRAYAISIDHLLGLAERDPQARIDELQEAVEKVLSVGESTSVIRVIGGAAAETHAGKRQGRERAA
ncbi:MAG TPA: helix-turn-helix transcriptional regulator [Burkholderiales bacterium]|nr:helix-turn-helix transcriptional regulator [Burkholderiales bacterium]